MRCAAKLPRACPRMLPPPCATPRRTGLDAGGGTGHLGGMDTDRRWGQRPPLLGSPPDGESRAPAPPRRTWLNPALGRVGGVALLLALAAGGLLLVAFAVLLLGLLLPVAVVAGLVAFGA